MRSTCSIGAVARRAGEGQAGVGDRHVDPAEALDGLRDRALERVEVGHVDLELNGAVAQAGGVLLEELRLEAHERDVRALGVQPLGRRCADATRGAGDEHGASVDVIRGHGRAAHAKTS